jgi:para-aminobenzoate synthetase component 1
LQRYQAEFSIAPGELLGLKQRMLSWANQFSILCFLDSNEYPGLAEGYECLLAAGCRRLVDNSGDDPLDGVRKAHDACRDWMFGHICYEYKDVPEPGLHSEHVANTAFPVMQFFVPEVVCFISRGQSSLVIESFTDPAIVYQDIMQRDEMPQRQTTQLQFTRTTSREQYLETIERLREHIGDGDCYEINYCTEAFCDDAVIDPLQVFTELNALSPAPFAAYYRLHDQYLMCASPERYLRHHNGKVVSQPIKGTARRDADKTTDDHNKEALRNDIKERAENVMIVDLVRNDLARCCQTGSVQVDELFGIYSFPQVHQMISTVSGVLRPNQHFTEAIRHTFPMGSMTGAPKYKVMQLIEQYENARRELFSGTVGYITPGGNFDFNVVIRSIFYNRASRRLSYITGGAITYDSVPGKEWEEMRLKAWALERIFAQS